MAVVLGNATLDQLVADKRVLISVEDTATVAEALKIMQDNHLLALPVSAPAGKWLGAGGSTVVEGNNQYIGFVSMLDFVMHVGAEETALEAALAEPITNLIGCTNEGMSLWVMSSKTLLIEALEPMSKGVHRILVAVSAPDSSGNKMQTHFYLLTQTDVVRAFLQHLDSLGPDFARPIQELGLVPSPVAPVTVSANTPVLEALRLMREAGGVTAVAVVQPEGQPEGSKGSMPGGRPNQGPVLATLSASDFRGLQGEMMRQLSKLEVMDYLGHMSGVGVPRPPVTCRPAAPLAEVMANAITTKVHRVWVTDESGCLVGVVTFTDLIKAARLVLLASAAS